MFSKKRIVNIVIVAAILLLIGTVVAPLVSASEDPSDPDHVDDEHTDDEQTEEEPAPPELPGFGILGAIISVGVLYLRKRK